MKTWVFVMLTMVFGAVVLAGVGEDLSGTQFGGTEAKAAQQGYNQAVRQAWREYQVKVNAAGRTFSAELETAYKKEVAADNLQEALKIKKEMGEFTFDLTKGLVLYMSFDKQGPAGKVLDNSGAGNHGKVNGAVWTEQGVSGGAYQFDIKRKTDRVAVPDSDSLDCKTITLCAWVKTDDNDEFWNRIVDKDWRTGYCLCLGGDFQGKQFRGKVDFEIDDKNGNIMSDNSIADNNWHQIIARYDGEFMEMYIDGQLQKARKQRTGQLTANTYPVGIGNTYPGYDMNEFVAFNGMLDEVAIYNRALSTREIRALREKSIDAVFPDKPAGVGVKVSNHQQGVIVDEVFNTASGLQKGDIIVGADGQSFADKSLMQAMKVLRGEEGSSVALDVRDAGGVVKKVTVTRKILTGVNAAGNKK